MKRFLAWLLLATAMLSLAGCGSISAPAETPAAPTEAAATELPATEVPVTVPVTEAAEEGSLFLKVSSVTFSLVGESEDIYLGLVPREQVSWESDDPAIVSVENGVLTANGVGTTTVRASYGSQLIEVSTGCLAATQEELEALDPEILSAPKRLPPRIDLEEPCTAFDNAAIMGDSITYHLWQTESQNDYLGKTLFLTRQGVSIMGLVLRSKNMYFEGKEMYIENIAAKCGAERIYIMLGCLDYQVEAARASLMDNWNTLLDRITQSCPDMEIVLVSNIPSLPEAFSSSEFNAQVAQTNIQLRQLAADRGFGFLDLAYYIQDHCGRLPALYSRDEFHMNTEGNLAWIKVLRHYAQFEQEGGTLA